MTEIVLMMSIMDLLTVNFCATELQGLSTASSLKAMPAHLVEGEGLETSALALQILRQLLAKDLKINHLQVVMLCQEG